MSPRIAFVTSRGLPHPDVDERLLLPLVPGGALVAWEDDAVDWASYDAVILRSTWNYTDHLDLFLAWAERVHSVTRLVNPLSVIRWNTDKRYLAELERAGFAVVPTVYVARGQAAPNQALDPALAHRARLRPAGGLRRCRPRRNAPVHGCHHHRAPSRLRV